MPYLSISLTLLIILTLTVNTNTEANVMTFSKTLYIPGKYFSLMNYTYNLEDFTNYFDVGMNFELTQVNSSSNVRQPTLIRVTQSTIFSLSTHRDTKSCIPAMTK